ncbi:hypothetical protein OS493_034319 [Desmophyllum pertusum]|uniref:6-phosphogluconate dehydrogenase NADP-binding domain-containing protein n=1 Tax=Desmophyllum pertusum TaxID=174260 RepID=A0A9X0CJZ9_9CNID|nr:hypothetical protein OS493_034319 [Desmophyllum pertusum]
MEFGSEEKSKDNASVQKTATCKDGKNTKKTNLHKMDSEETSEFQKQSVRRELIKEEIAKTQYEKGKKGIGVLEAPVTGGMALLKQGKMTVLVGGDKQLFQDCAPILQQSSKMVLYMGEIGTTYTMIAKLISNMLAAVNVVTMGDALQLGKLVAWIWTN